VEFQKAAMIGYRIIESKKDEGWFRSDEFSLASLPTGAARLNRAWLVTSIAEIIWHHVFNCLWL
jgi:hypothetical protein